MYFHRGGHLPRRDFPTRHDQRAENLAQKRDLVRRGLAHGIIVYADGAAVGWCQYGRVHELPLRSPADDAPDWRITCFVTDKSHRRNGVGTVALHAAVRGIARKGGGLVEGYPILFGGGLLYVDGVGPVSAPRGTFGNVSTTGTVSMFEGEGFTAVSVTGSTRVVMRRQVEPVASSRGTGRTGDRRGRA